LIKKRTTVENIIEVVGRVFGVPVEGLHDDCRVRNYVIARHAAAWLARELTDNSYPGIGAAMGRNHSSVIYAVEQFRLKWAKYPAIMKAVKDIREEILGGPKAQPHPIGSIAAPFDVTVKPVKIKRIRHSPPGRPRTKFRKLRPCMTCGKNFISEGNHNRMCVACRHGDHTTINGVAV